MRAHVRAGVAIFNTGEWHAAHDAWEDKWLALEADTPDERFLHGLIQYTAACYHLRTENWAGASGLAESALDYLDGLDDEHRGVALVEPRGMLSRMAGNPSTVDPDAVPPLRYDGTAIGLADLEPPACMIAGEVLAEEWADVDPELLTDAINRWEKRRDPRIESYVTAFLTAGDDRGIVIDRLRRYLEREAARADDVARLFDDQSS